MLNFKNWLKENAWGSQGAFVLKQPLDSILKQQANKGVGAFPIVNLDGKDLPPTPNNKKMRKK